jgi:hypothetical protein
MKKTKFLKSLEQELGCEISNYEVTNEFDENGRWLGVNIHVQKSKPIEPVVTNGYVGVNGMKIEPIYDGDSTPVTAYQVVDHRGFIIFSSDLAGCLNFINKQK